ncbi:MAG: hypothetical protein JWQ96_823 [Segetibacter sp.]|nr:hypothetical protein [Segetibacter sp.]
MPQFTKVLGKFLLAGCLLVTDPAIAKSGNHLPDDKMFPSLFGNNYSAESPIMKRTADSLYDIIGLGMYGLERDVFFNGYKGYQYFLNKSMLRKTNILTICDYSQSSNNKRLYVIDVLNGRLLFNTFVSHGKNSGEEFATSFSNMNNSNKSSLGFLISAETYSGKAGLSMRFNGMEQGFNDLVKTRNIVLHGSRYVNESIMNDRGTIGKSLGCPAVPYGIHTRIIDAIKGGSCFFINSPDEHYARSSKILNSKFDMFPANNFLINAVAGKIVTGVDGVAGNESFSSAGGK